MNTNQQAHEAIAESVQTNAITYIDRPTEADRESLMVECEDHVVNGAIEEFWGVDIDEQKWRVHIPVKR